MRDLIGKLFLGKNGSSESKPMKPEEASSKDEEKKSLPENAAEGGEERSIEQTIEMTPVESVPQAASDSASAATGDHSWTDEDKANTKPLTPPVTRKLRNVASVRETQSTVAPPFLQATQRSHVGKHRTRNEDSTFIFTADSGGEKPLLPFGLYVVADGMGGHYAGHEASRCVAWLVASTVLERIYIPMLESNLPSSRKSREPVLEVLVDAVQDANQVIYNPEPNKDSGTTLTAGLIFGQRLFIAHVGDSRAYIYDHGDLTLLTTDHTYVRRLQDAGQLTEEEAAVHPQRNMLYKAVGQGGMLEIDTFTRSLPERGSLMLCSDGLWGLVEEKLVREVLSKEVTLSEKSEKLVSMALDAGGHDNISVVLVNFAF